MYAAAAGTTQGGAQQVKDAVHGQHLHFTWLKLRMPTRDPTRRRVEPITWRRSLIGVSWAVPPSSGQGFACRRFQGNMLAAVLLQAWDCTVKACFPATAEVRDLRKSAD